VVETHTGRAVAKCDHGSCSVQLDVGTATGWRQRGARLPSGWLAVRGRAIWCPMHQPTLSDFGLADVYGNARAA